ncbi:MAG: hypothetical protein JW723_05540 [Bacteroidales bacterium]|nr:hypothetical protein [Bacteroidales bacterium]
MKILKTLTAPVLILFTTEIFGQYLPDSYQPMLNEIVTHFETIRGTNSITQGKNTLSIIDENKIALRINHKKTVKNLTFIKEPDEEGSLYWVAANEITTDMVNKYEDFLTKILESMHKLSEKKSKE